MVIRDEERHKLVAGLVAMEWEMFHNVKNKDGQAACQVLPGTFDIMRESQMLTWTREILESYQQDLERARAEGRNLLSEKYTYMMEYTNPLEYAQLKHQLPQLSQEMLERIERIQRIYMRWENVANRSYPRLRGRGRPASAEIDSPERVSVEIYLYGELKTYSDQTLGLLLDYVERMEQEGHNLVLENLTYMVHSYGYKDLETAEAALGG